MQEVEEAGVPELHPRLALVEFRQGNEKVRHRSALVAEEIGQMVADARRRHDEEILQYLEPGDVDLDAVVEERRDGNGA